MRHLGPIYDLDDGTRLQDIDAGCGSCGKRLCEVVHDPHNVWRAGQIVCLDEGITAPVYVNVHPAHTIRIVPSKRAPGKFIAVCTCRRFSMITSRENAQKWATKHSQAAA
jgi:hypothetical protein